MLQAIAKVAVKKCLLDYGQVSLKSKIGFKAHISSSATAGEGGMPD